MRETFVQGWLHFLHFESAELETADSSEASLNHKTTFIDLLEADCVQKGHKCVLMCR